MHSVLIVESNPHFRQIATRLLQDYYSSELSVVSASPSHEHVLQIVQEIRPHIILLDLDQQCQVSLHLITEINAVLPDVGIIALGSIDLEAYREAAQEAGADAFVVKSQLNNELLPAIHTITGLKVKIHNRTPYE